MLKKEVNILKLGFVISTERRLSGGSSTMIQLLLTRRYWQNRSSVRCHVNGETLTLDLTKTNDFSWVDFSENEYQTLFNRIYCGEAFRFRYYDTDDPND